MYIGTAAGLLLLRHDRRCIAAGAGASPSTPAAPFDFAGYLHRIGAYRPTKSNGTCSRLVLTASVPDHPYRRNLFPARNSLIVAPGLRSAPARSTTVSNGQLPDQSGATRPPPQVCSFQ